MTPPADSSRPSADSLLADWIARHEGGEEVDFEAVCREHPQQAERLRALHSHRAELEQIRRPDNLQCAPGLGGEDDLDDE